MGSIYIYIFIYRSQVIILNTFKQLQIPMIQYIYNIQKRVGHYCQVTPHKFLIIYWPENIGEIKVPLKQNQQNRIEKRKYQSKYFVNFNPILLILIIFPD